MRKDKKLRVVALVALCISVLGLSLGFAAFSNTLTISSSATVSPDETDFDINIYGMEENALCDRDFSFDLLSSATIGAPDCNSTSKSATVSEISDSGKSVTISNIEVGFSEPDEDAYYYYLIKNEGEYDAYLDVDSLVELFNGKTGTCVPSDDANVDMVNKACESIKLYVALTGVDGDNYVDVSQSSVYKLGKGSTILVEMGIRYKKDGERADGDFSVDFDDIVLEFTSVSPGE